MVDDVDQGGVQPRVRDGLVQQQEPVRPGFGETLRRRVAGHHDGRNGRVEFAAHPFDDVGPKLVVAQPEIADDEVRAARHGGRHGDGLVARAGDDDAVSPSRQDAEHRGANGGLVVDDDDQAVLDRQAGGLGFAGWQRRRRVGDRQFDLEAGAATGDGP